MGVLGGVCPGGRGLVVAGLLQCVWSSEATVKLQYVTVLWGANTIIGKPSYVHWDCGGGWMVVCV